MLRLQPFDLEQPRTLDEVVALLAASGRRARIVSGGTDLLPNLKLGQVEAEVLVSLRRVEALTRVEVEPEAVAIGSGVRIADVAVDPDVVEHAPALAHAASRIASPQLRNMGTLGGNLCLDTRCRYINQSELWRDALGGCLKSHGSECHVVPGGQGCVAALSADTVPVLIAHRATVDVVGPAGWRTTHVAELYDTDGTAHVRLAPDEVLVRVRVPKLSAASAVVYRKWSVRKSIDFPLVSVAVRLDRDPEARSKLASGLIAVGVLGPRPRVLDLGKLAGCDLDSTLADRLAQMAFDRCKPLPNVLYEPEYRRERLAVEVRRAVLELVGRLS